jgi:hypothetical protein
MVINPAGKADTVRFFKVVDQLIDSERAKPGSKKSD